MHAVDAGPDCPRPPLAHGRRGAALATVLWLVAALAAMLVAVVGHANVTLLVVEQRTALLRGGWLAEECAERARATVDHALREVALGRGRGDAWVTLDEMVATAHRDTPVGQCDISLTPSGRAVDVNSIDDASLSRLLAAVGVPSPVADSLRDALLDWRDGDDDPRALGAERAWYDAAGRIAPTNARLGAIEELARVRGFDTLDPTVAARLHDALGVEPGGLSFAHAAPAALATLPGFTPEIVALVLDDRASRRRGPRLPDGFGAPPLEALAGDARLTPAARAALSAHWTQLQALVAAGPERWTLSARAVAHDVGSVASAATVEFTLVRAGARAAVMRRRLHP